MKISHKADDKIWLKLSKMREEGIIDVKETKVDVCRGSSNISNVDEKRNSGENV